MSEWNPPQYGKQVLVIANNEDEAKIVSGLNDIKNVFRWDGRTKFFYEGVEMSIRDFLNQISVWGELIPQVVTDDLFVDINHLIEKKSKKSNNNVRETMDLITNQPIENERTLRDHNGRIINVGQSVRPLMGHWSKKEGLITNIDRTLGVVTVEYEDGEVCTFFNDTIIVC